MTQTDQLPMLLLMGNGTCDRRSVIEAGMESSWRIEEWRPEDSEERLGELLRVADAVIPGGDALQTGAFFRAIRNAPKLKFLQLPFTGFEWLDVSSLPEGCIAANAYGHEIAMAEFVMGAMLQWEKDFFELDSSFRKGSWKYRAVGVNDFAQGELAGKSMGIIGYGAIGAELAKRAHAFDMQVHAVSRTERECPAPLMSYGTMDKLPDLVASSDYLVLTCALNDETRGLIGTEEFALMRDDATLVNVARGGVADEDALFAALKNKTIRGAILDVWYVYPKGYPPNPETGGGAPSKHDFASLDNVIMTPHCSANTEGSDIRRYLGIATNLDLVATGELPETYIGTGAAPRT